MLRYKSTWNPKKEILKQKTTKRFLFSFQGLEAMDLVSVKLALRWLGAAFREFKGDSVLDETLPSDTWLLLGNMLHACLLWFSG